METRCSSSMGRSTITGSCARNSQRMDRDPMNVSQGQPIENILLTEENGNKKRQSEDSDWPFLRTNACKRPYAVSYDTISGTILPTRNKSKSSLCYRRK